MESFFFDVLGFRLYELFSFVIMLHISFHEKSGRVYHGVNERISNEYDSIIEMSMYLFLQAGLLVRNKMYI